MRASAAALHPENCRVLETAVGVEEAVVDMHRGGDNHRPSHRSAGARSAEPDGQERTAAGFAQTGRDRVQFPWAESELFEHSAGLLQARATEPAEKFLRPVGDQRAPDTYPQGEEAEITSGRSTRSRSAQDRVHGCRRPQPRRSVPSGDYWFGARDHVTGAARSCLASRAVGDHPLWVFVCRWCISHHRRLLSASTKGRPRAPGTVGMRRRGLWSAGAESLLSWRASWTCAGGAVIIGPAGVGKTTLASTGLQLAQERSVLISPGGGIHLSGQRCRARSLATTSCAQTGGLATTSGATPVKWIPQSPGFRGGDY